MSKKTIAAWANDWLGPARLKRGWFDGRKAHSLFIANQILPKYAKADDGSESMEDARRRRERAKADIEEMERDELKRELIREGEAIKWVSAILTEAKMVWMALPRRLAAEAYGREPREIEAICRRHIYQGLLRLSRSAGKKTRKKKNVKSG